MPAPTLRRPLVLASVMAAMFMIAIEATIVATAMPQIVGQLGDLHLYSWVFSAYLLSQTAMTVVFGKMSDLFGRKPVLLIGIVIFLVGSALCGLAGSLFSLIVYRLIQGIGAGAIQPVTMTVVGDLYPVQERGKIQGYLASVWGISSVLGPLAGSLIVHRLGWSWVFWVNIPVGLAAMAAFAAFLREDVERKHHHLDVLGAGLFTVAVAALMVVLTGAGTADRTQVLVAGVITVAASVLFVLQERRTADPILAFGLWSRRPIATANAATLLSGMAVTGMTTFLPVYVQGVMSQSALVAGFTLTMMSLGWPIAATATAKLSPRWGLRATLLAGAALIPVGALFFVLLRSSLGPVPAGIGSLVMGFGMGALSTSAIMLVQGCVEWGERGSATASNLFARTLGSTLGAAGLGAVLNASLADGHASPEQVRRLLEQPGSAAADAATQLALGQSLHVTFWAVFLLAALVFAVSLLVPRTTPAAPARAAAE